MVKQGVVRRGRRLIGHFEEGRIFQIAWNKSNLKDGSINLPIKTFDLEIVNNVDTLALTNEELYYWLNINEFLAYATKIKGSYVVPLYNFKCRRL